MQINHLLHIVICTVFLVFYKYTELNLNNLKPYPKYSVEIKRVLFFFFTPSD